MIGTTPLFTFNFSSGADLTTWDCGNMGQYKNVTLLGEWLGLVGSSLDAVVSMREKKAEFSNWVDVPLCNGLLDVVDGTFEFTNAIFTSEEVGLYIAKNHVYGGTLNVYLRAE